MTDRYCIFGNPVAHSKSPTIHTAFAAQTEQDMHYTAMLPPLDGFADAVRTFQAAGGRGANVTVPFKEQAFRRSTQRTPRAEMAGAVNTLTFNDKDILGDNTDGAGLVRDLSSNLAFRLKAQRILLLGAGGAARGVLAPLLAAQPASLLIANRTLAKAQALVPHFSAHGPVAACTYAELLGQSFDLVINATSASLSGDLPPLPPGIFAADSLAYDMMYASGETPFLTFARQQGAARLADGIGMLVEQAAESFFVWRGIRPMSAPVIHLLRGV
jgi:shikimate dehydrogenase